MRAKGVACGVGVGIYEARIYEAHLCEAHIFETRMND